MSDERLQRERKEFIKASSETYYPYSWEMDGHPAMRRPSLRRVRQPWRQTKSDWIKGIVFLTITAGLFLLVIFLGYRNA